MAGSDSSRKPRKTLKAVKDKRFPSMLRLVFEEGGKVPAALAGQYKSHAKANKAIEYYNAGYDREKIYPRAPALEKPSAFAKSVADTGMKLLEVLEAPKGDTSLYDELQKMDELFESVDATAPPTPTPPKRSVETDGEERCDS